MDRHTASARRTARAHSGPTKPRRNACAPTVAASQPIAGEAHQLAGQAYRHVYEYREKSSFNNVNIWRFIDAADSPIPLRCIARSNRGDDARASPVHSSTSRQRSGRVPEGGTRARPFPGVLGEWLRTCCALRVAQLQGDGRERRVPGPPAKCLGAPAIGPQARMMLGPVCGGIICGPGILPLFVTAIRSFPFHLSNSLVWPLRIRHRPSCSSTLG